MAADRSEPGAKHQWVSRSLRTAPRVVMPIRLELRPLYPPNWRALSSHVRFERASGRCQRCARPHLALIRCLPDGRWFDEQAATWRDHRGRTARWPDLVEIISLRTTRVVLATAHLDSDPSNNRLTNLRAFCQRCHMLHDRPQHLVQRWITYRRRQALGDLFLGPYAVLLTTLGTSPHASLQVLNRSKTTSSNQVVAALPAMLNRRTTVKLLFDKQCTLIPLFTGLPDRERQIIGNVMCG
jgi:hypothetical protein